MITFSRVAGLALSAVIIFSGCSGPAAYRSSTAAPYVAPTHRAPHPTAAPVSAQGLYHTVRRGQTIWRISRMYGVSVQDITAANQIKNVHNVPAGARVWIPTILTPVAVEAPQIPLYPDTGRWKYIVVHHTATQSGDAATIDRSHRKRGFGSMGYHFLIDNGSKGKRDGQIEIGRRWVRQQRGAHARADNMNEKGIGVALVGNFSTEKVSDKELDSLVEVVRLLMKHYHVPKSRVVRHRDVKGARTECPGTRFPWSSFKSRL